MNYIFGGAGNDVLLGTTNDDYFYGYSGNDVFIGGPGNDFFLIEDFGDRVIEVAGGGDHDTIVSRIQLTNATDNVENYYFDTAAPVSFTGNSLDNSIQGGTGNDVLWGYGGTDWIQGRDGDDALLGWTGKDTLFGNNGNDTLNGLGNDDYLDGGAGADVMYGGDGNDTFFVDNVGDRAIETGGGGTKDMVYSTVNLPTAFANVDWYVFEFSGAHFTGSSGNETIYGADGADVLHGGGGTQDRIVGWGGNDLLYLDSGDGYLGGGNGSDHLYGGPGFDTLDGGAGADIMEGGGGRDIYWVDNIGDRVIEGAAVSTDDKEDSVWAFISLTSLAANVEDVVIAGSGDLNATGNALDNSLVGNDGKNVLNGGAGNDSLYGDGIYATQSNDTLTGGAGSDQFGFTLGFGWGSGADTITDFSKSTDRLRFDNVGDRNGDHVINIADLLLDVTSFIDHGVGNDVNVTFINGNSITFQHAGTSGALHNLADLVASPTQIETYGAP